MNVSRTMIVALVLGIVVTASGQDIRVENADQLRAALRTLAPGVTIRLAAGTYKGRFDVHRAVGTAEKPILITGPDTGKPATIASAGEGMHLTDCAYVTLRNLRVTGARDNGINIDDGGSYETPSHHVTLENVRIERTGPRGNHDALKLSGLDDFTIRGCTFDGWGGSAIDMVGCHRGLIEGCAFLGRAGFTQATGVQCKGGTTDVSIRTSYFENAGGRAVNIGGSTGLRWFRPKQIKGYEARNIEVAGNRFVGSLAPIAFVTADDCRVHHNTFVNPGKWVIRILQETGDKRFNPCRNGVFENNLIVYDRRVRVFVNIGPGTAAKTFVFRRNAWYTPGRKARPVLPAEETDGVYDVDPKLNALRGRTIKITSSDARLKDIGADAYVPPLSRPSATRRLGRHQWHMTAAMHTIEDEWAGSFGGLDFRDQGASP